MGSSILPFIAQGPTPVQATDVLGQAAKVAGIQTQRAQTQNVEANTAQTQEATHGIALENTLKQRSVDAQKALVGLLKQNTTQLSDGSTATNMGNVIGQYRSLYPDKALELEQKSLEVENQRTIAAKNQFDLGAAQQKHLGFSLGTAGFTDPDSASRDPNIVAKFANLYDQATKDGTAHLIGITPQQFAQNPQAYIPKLSNLVNQSGAKSEALRQASDQIDLRTKQLGQVREAYAQGMEGLTSPGDYSKLIRSISDNFDPHVVAAANLAPPNTIQTPQQLAAAKQSAALTQMSPSERVNYVDKVRHETAEEANQRLTAAAEAAKAGTAAGELRLKQFESSQAFGPQAFGPTGGAPSARPVATGGAPTAPTQSAPVGRAAGSLTPPVNGPRAQAALATPAAPVQPTAQPPASPQAAVPAVEMPILNVDGKKIDLNGTTPLAREWQSKPPLVRDMALRLLDGSSVPGGGGMAGVPGMALQNQAATLASKINPHYAQQADARKEIYGTEAQQKILSANTAISHSANLLSAAQKLGNGNFTPINKLELIKNAMTGKEEPTDFENIRDAYVREIGKYFAGGQMGQTEFQEAAGRIATANSLKQLQGAVRENNKLLMGGMKEREQQFNDLNNGAILGNRQQFITDDSKKVLKGQGLLKSVTQTQLQDYAKKHLGGDVDRATKEAKSKGYEIER